MLPLSRCVLRAQAGWLCCSLDGKPRRVWAKLVGWPLPVSGTCVIAPRLRGGGVERFVPPAPVRAVGRPRVPLAVCTWRAVPPAAGRPPTLGGRRRTSWTLCLLPGGSLSRGLPVGLARLAWEWWGCAPVWCGASWTSVGDRWQMMSAGRWGRWGLHGLCPKPRGRRLAVLQEEACGCGAASGQGSFPWGVRAALVPPRGERSEGASVRARGGTRPGWWPLVASWGVTACFLPVGLRDLLGPWSPVTSGLSLVPRGPRDGSDVVPLHGCTDAQGCALVPPPVWPVHFLWAVGPHMRHEPGGHVVPLAGVVHGGGVLVFRLMAEGDVCHGADSLLEVAGPRSRQPSDADCQGELLPCGEPVDA